MNRYTIKTRASIGAVVTTPCAAALLRLREWPTVRSVVGVLVRATSRVAVTRQALRAVISIDTVYWIDDAGDFWIDDAGERWVM